MHLFADKGHDVGVVDFLLLVGQNLERLEQAAELFAAEFEAQGLGAVGQGGTPAVLAQHQVAHREAHVLGMHDLVGRAFLEHAVLVDAGLVGEGVLADNGFVPLHLDARNAGDEPAGGHEPPRVDAGFRVEMVMACAQGHDDFFERTVAGPLAQAVDGTFDLAGARFDGGQTIGHGHAQVVVAVDADHGLVDVRHAIAERADDVAHVVRRGVADGVGDVHRSRAGGNGRFDDLAQKIGLGPRGVLGRELDVRAIADRALHAGHRVADDVVLVHLQLVLAMDSAGGEKDVDPRPLGVANRFPRAVDVGLAAAGQAADDRAADRAGDLAHGLEIARRGDRETGLDHVDAQFHQRVGDFHLLGQVHARAGRLFAVAERGVENHNASRGCICHGAITFCG